MKFIAHALILTALILTLNLSLRTMLVQDDNIWQDRLEVHQNEKPFSLRPLTTLATRVLSEYGGLSVRDAFIVGQYPLVFALLLSFATLLGVVGLEARWRLIGMWALALSFPILCVHFIPNYTWDDLWAYLGLSWMAVCLIRRRYFAASLCLLFAAISRESALITLPAFLFFRDRNTSWGRVLAAAAIPVACYAILRTVAFPDVSPGRFECYRLNFADSLTIGQSLHSLFVSFGWLWVAGWLGVRRVFSQGLPNRNAAEWGLATSTLVIGLVCIGVTMLFTLARETRLFFVPFEFLIPLAVLQLRELRERIEISRLALSCGRLAMMGALLVAASVALSVVLFPSFPFLPMLDFHRVFFALNLAAAILFWLLGYQRVRQVVFPPR